MRRLLITAHPFILFLALSACMQAEKVSLDSSGLEGLLLNGITFNANAVAGGGNGGTTPPPAPTPPTLTATSPTASAAIDIQSYTTATFTLSESLDSTVTPVVHIYIVRSGTPVELVGLNPTVNVAFNSIGIDPRWGIWPERVRLRFVIEKDSVKDQQGESPESDLSLEFTTTPFAGYRARIPYKDRVYTNHGGATPHYREPDAGLSWMPCVQGKTGADCSGGSATLYTFEQAQAACGALNVAPGYAGITFWRTPTVSELETLPDYGRKSPAISPTFPNTPSTFHWTSSSTGVDDGTAWAVNFDTGEVRRVSKANAYPVRCMYSAKAFHIDYINDLNSCSIGPAPENLCYAWDSNYSWPRYDRCPLGWNYNVALNTCESGTDTGTQDNMNSGCAWRDPMTSRTRLTTINELKYLMRRHRPSDPVALVDASDSIYWSAIRLAGDVNQAFAVDFATGEVILRPVTENHAGRCMLAAPF